MTKAPDPLPRLDATAVAALQERILGWYAANRRDLPWRHTTDPYAILVSETMLQQTQVARVVARYTEWLGAYPTLETLADAPLRDVLRRWSGLGYNTRARRLRDCAAAVVAAPAGAQHAERAKERAAAALPRTYQDLLRLPGVGPYTARAVLIFAHNDDVAAVDANVRRVLLHELILDEALPAGSLQRVAEAVVPRGRSRDWHNALMDYGALVLTARTTGIAPRTRQGAFEGSHRQQRARLLRLLIGAGPRHTDQVAAALGLQPAAAAELIEALTRDGLVRRTADTVTIA